MVPKPDLTVPRRNSVSGALIVAVDVTELKMAQKAVSELRQLLPVCAWCGDIQNDDGGWETVAQYLGERMQTSVTHGMCPNCQQEQTLALDRPKGWDSRY